MNSELPQWLQILHDLQEKAKENAANQKGK